MLRLDLTLMLRASVQLLVCYFPGGSEAVTIRNFVRIPDMLLFDGRQPRVEFILLHGKFESMKQPVYS
jgi:hypothetical protein